ncbi:Uncharacterised protein [Peptoniphilus indolicus]|uniref:TraG family protein n=2 Tax=Peptoniphilus indolicus TaxID=33030 RepID=G4D3E7_9FIRM|nr:TraG family protein [Peptoniphilus indolicus ATCC 29427]SUB74990.1 Uncharacterised protein [Peptoniphilus indolicus]SUB94776.1 Uncharacterised protein [Peptoniphilus indolicus]
MKAEKLYYKEIIGYIFYEAPREENNFTALLDTIDFLEVREDEYQRTGKELMIQGEIIVMDGANTFFNLEA